MKNLSLFAFTLIIGSVVLMGAGCSKDAPLTLEEQAAEVNMTVEEYNEMKGAASRMNMSPEEHMQMGN